MNLKDVANLGFGTFLIRAIVPTTLNVKGSEKRRSQLSPKVLLDGAQAKIIMGKREDLRSNEPNNTLWE